MRFYKGYVIGFKTAVNPVGDVGYKVIDVRDAKGRQGKIKIGYDRDWTLGLGSIIVISRCFYERTYGKIHGGQKRKRQAQPVHTCSGHSIHHPWHYIQKYICRTFQHPYPGRSCDCVLQDVFKEPREETDGEFKIYGTEKQYHFQIQSSSREVDTEE